MSDQPTIEVVEGWLRRARSDLQLGKAALCTAGVLPEDACFHAQQCAEKALKGLLSLWNTPFPRTHAVEVLLDLLKAGGAQIPENVDEAYELSQYAVQARYPGDWEPVTLEEAIQALKLAEDVLLWVGERVAQTRVGTT